MALSTLAGRGILGAEHFGDDFFAGERGEGERRDEFVRRARHHHLHVEIFLLQAAHQFRGFVSCHSAGDAKRDFHGMHGELTTSAAFLPFFGVSVEFGQFVFEQPLLQFFFRDARGLARARIIHQRPPADHQLPRAPRDHDHIRKLAIRYL